MNKLFENKASLASFNKAFKHQNTLQTSARTKAAASRSTSKKAGETKQSAKDRDKLRLRFRKVMTGPLSRSGSASQTSQNVSLQVGLESHSQYSDRIKTENHIIKPVKSELPTMKSIYDQFGKGTKIPDQGGFLTMRSLSHTYTAPIESAVLKKSLGGTNTRSGKLHGRANPISFRTKQKGVVLNAPVPPKKDEMAQFKKSLAAGFREAVTRRLTNEKNSTTTNSPTKKHQKISNLSQSSLKEYHLKSVHKLIDYLDRDPTLKNDKQHYRTSLQEFRKVTESRERLNHKAKNERFIFKGILGIIR